MKKSIIGGKRLDWIDCAKGVGIIFVIIGHCSIESVKEYIYLFHMPLFFIISGFLWNREKYSKMCYKDFFVYKWHKLIIPYFKIAGTCFILFGIVLLFHRYGFGELYLNTLIKYVYGIVIYSKGTSEWFPLCFPLWFMTCLFCSEIIMKIIFDISNKSFQIFLLVAASGFIGYCLSFVGKIPWNIDTAFSSIPLLFIGYFCRNHWNEISRTENLIVLLPLTIFIFFYGVKGVDFNFNTYTNLPLVYIQSSIITITIFIVLQRIKMKGKTDICLQLFRYYGKNTIAIMGYHCVFIEFVKRIPGCHDNWLLVLVVIGLCTVFILITNHNRILKGFLY